MGMTLKEISLLSDESVAPQEVIDIASTHAKNIREKAVHNEPSITQLMKSLEDENSHLVGLDHVLKGEQRIASKIFFDHHHAGISLDDAAKRIGDSVRYTMIIDSDLYTERAMSILNAIKNKGYTIVKASNTWDKSLYKGLNCSIISPDGVIFELQFHTKKSFDIKEDKTHLVYEIRRNEYIRKNTALSELRDLATEIQRLYTSTIPIPRDVIGFDFMKGLSDENEL